MFKILALALWAALLTTDHDCCFDDDDERAETYEDCLASVPQPDFVCGEDGRSYASVCDADFADVDVVADGPCPGDTEPPISFDVVAD
ncbi:MAG: Kazal-type serine protease inhibitor [Myxococcota bacterium]